MGMFGRVAVIQIRLLWACSDGWLLYKKWTEKLKKFEEILSMNVTLERRLPPVDSVAKDLNLLPGVTDV